MTMPDFRCALLLLAEERVGTRVRQSGRHEQAQLAESMGALRGT